MPESTYARCKDELHAQLRGLLAAKNVSLAWARVFYPYGEGEHVGRLASSVITQLRAGKPVKLKTPRSVKDYIHVEDVASALLTLVEKEFNGAVNIGTGDGVTVETIARRLGEFLARPELVCASETSITDPVDVVIADSTRIRSLGWRPEISLEEGLRGLVEARCA